MAHASNDSYYIPHGSHWPLVGSVGLFTMLAGAANWLNGSSTGVYILAIGALTIIYMVFGWFGTVIRESEAGSFHGRGRESKSHHPPSPDSLYV